MLWIFQGCCKFSKLIFNGMTRSYSKKKFKRNSSSRSSRRSNRRSRDRSRERRGYKSRRVLFDATPRRSNSRSRSRGRSHARRSRSRSRSRRRTSSRRSQSRDSKLAEVLQQLLKEKKSPAASAAPKVPQQMLRGNVSSDLKFRYTMSDMHCIHDVEM